MLDQAGPVRSGENLDLRRLEKWLRLHLAVKGPLSIEQFPSGHSNLTYLIRVGDEDFVLRRPPFGNQVQSAHDMGREYRVLSRLCEVYAPAPRPYVYCEDTNIIGDEFYIMERRHGVVLRGNNMPKQLVSDPDAVRRSGLSLIDNLAALHALDFKAAGLGDFGKPAGYTERQVTGWNERYDKAKTDRCPEVEQLGQWLQKTIPPDSSPTLVHNDYKYDNVMVSASDLTTIVAVFDWEMATIGNPLMDLGTSLSYWIQADDPEDIRKLAFGPTMLPGSPSRQELATRYAEVTDTALPEMLYYYCFGIFKLAVILQQIYARYARGVTKDARFAGMNSEVAALGRFGISAAESAQY
ncbi:MAG: phosphotransferase family protein [Fuerstiella sp.]|nr:phosphotransferase family protein [Fuerstiella sp.]